MLRKYGRRLERLRFIWPIIFVLIGTTAVILYGRGYRPDFRNNSLKPTGLLSATSDPKGAQVYIDNVLKTATDNTLNIDPGWYTVTISKEGYISWQKKLRVQGEIVSRADAFLFPKNPSLSPLTTAGVEKPLLSPDGTKIAYVIAPDGDNTSQKAGLWVYELVERPLGLNRDPRLLGLTDVSFDFSQSDLIWSPDSTEIMAKESKTVRLYNTTRTGSFQDVSLTFESILADWQTEKITKEKQQLVAFKQGFIDVATSSAQIIAFSPDETKVLYEATASATIPEIVSPPLIGTNPTEEKRTIESGKLYVYDSREDKNYFLLDESELSQPKTSPAPSINSKLQGPNPKWFDKLTISSSLSLRAEGLSRVEGQIKNTNDQNPKQFGISGAHAPVYWFPTSRHLVLTLPGKIDILEYDRTNWVTVYAGPFVDGFVAPWPNGSRLIVMTNLNPGVSKLPNLYTVNLR